ncbi:MULTISPECIES: potassium channel family protein [unclassified Lentimicrobium]|uniref:potassium channel family protein n=1 Tax=unclassified Lentimicrobium TaxID=2677434 RepID=UPI0015552880|nr:MULTISPECIES: potassium channel family protein [unclassified Lentimicrobium]NPD44744.1 two pore domain potassium channel family protein [Lentimicrobium sp. S6]NPD83400.1 two pore domain potassium channel family protein [Lentimicrobium sp. L6]
MQLFHILKKIPSQIYLFSGILLFVFVFPLIDRVTIFDFVGPLAYSIMTISILSVIERKKQKKLKYLFILVAISIIFIWVMYFSPRSYLSLVSFVLSLSVFFTTIVLLIQQIVQSKEVNTKVILEAISAYLLLGVMFTLTNSLIWTFDHDSIGITSPDIADFVYYSFITLTTIGYGDISPVSDLAKMTSILFGLSGQLYLTIIMAFIIGKFLNR